MSVADLRDAALDHLVDAAKRVLTDAPPALGEVPDLSVEAVARISRLVGELIRPRSNLARVRARTRLAALAAVGLLVVGTSAPVTSQMSPRKIWPPCPKCGAKPGERCTSDNGHTVKTHVARRSA